jgi:hypothetical protein
MKRRLAAAATAASALGAACLSIPPFQPTALMSYTEDGSGALVTTTTTNSSSTSINFTLHFAGGGLRFPDALKIDDVEVMGHATSPCWGQSGTGFALVPMPRISGDGGLSATTDQFRAVLSGPAVVQVEIDWTAQFGCSPPPKQVPTGTSTFTVFPNGRIVRHDQLYDPNPTNERLSASDCMCLDPPVVPGAFILSSYWAFERTRFPKQYGLGRSGDPATPDGLDFSLFPIIPNYDTMCLDSSDSAYQVASVWAVPAGVGPVAFSYDALISHDLQKPGNGVLDFPWDIHGALFIEHGGCTTALQRAIEYTNPPMVTIDTTMPVPFSPLNGIYGGDPDAHGDRGFLLPDGHGTLTAEKLPFAVWLRFPSPVDGVRAIAPDETGSWYTPQRIDDDRNWIVWFQDPLAAGKMIQLEPL